jgi:hypothetical protein
VEFCVSLRLSDIRRDPVANRALRELSRRYTVAESKTGLVLSQQIGDMKLFVHDLADLHQWDFLWNVRLRKSLLATDEQRREWECRALAAEKRLAELATNVPDTQSSPNASDVRFAALRRYLAKQFHPDHAPGQGIEKAVRNEIFKEIWAEIERLNHPATSPNAASARG